ncbi:Putative phage head-tail adaptor OS=Clostridium sporogenes ATCC 15579 GN=CLOSPO_00710 PE=4 SV=1: HATPase_c_3 [Gemmata massiliana]|uniref:HD-CE domain-containing protein n=1 Tax=Gemmata massiliana TaxID=1210884 RepID=A0A6P2D188_9BACT|nr:ATP-binding protein [Gemmata massiliana]VTR93220.1 Putative phage head-tail adaptor OS=Clostridium sporogenes ATCC 15579 GN=CLOSPO_00710 PE=4 SV=1: HATPase_c_3 [Gemmata massiliana]
MPLPEPFKITELWKTLAARPAELDIRIRVALEPMLDKAEMVLREGAPATKDFTLHDEAHAFRVAQRMHEIINGEVLEKLSSYELALLLLSAYLHDIGMAPKRKHVERHRRHLLRGDAEQTDKLNDAEAAEVRKFLDNSPWNVELPLVRDGKADEAAEVLANEIVTDYCRHKHNDWSEAWINENLPAGNADHALPNYPGWRDDLILICRSHHYGYEHLKTDKFLPTLVWSHHIVHRRYLACVLRVADVLENDPERTPAVLFEHRGVRASSEVYWQKDHYLNVTRDGDHLAVVTEPTSAALEKAVRTTVEWIEAELRLCVQLASELPFQNASFSTKEPLPHRWDYPAVVVPTINAKGGYVYIEGAFRPNTRRLLELLSGVELYQNPLVAVRELLQNAFDAVREAIAVKRLQEIALGEDPGEDDLAKRFTVDLRLEERDGRLWLICRDDGVGMNRRVIENYLLVSGSSRRHEIEEINRRCQVQGFKMGRTGKFGIGALSYFMLADRVEFKTARRNHPLDTPETDGWHFITNGVGAFGELRTTSRYSLGDGGCEVTLRVRKELSGKDDEGKGLSERLEEYLRETVRRIPCRLRWSLDVTKSQWTENIAPGWTLSDGRRNGLFVHGIHESVDSILGLKFRDPFATLTAPRNEIAALSEKSEKIIDAIIKRTHWKVQEIRDKAGDAIARIHMPWFNLVAGESNVVILHDSVFADFGIDLSDCQGVSPPEKLCISWRGMDLDIGSDELNQLESIIPRGLMVEVDFSDEAYGSPTVNRGSLSASERRLSFFQQISASGSALAAGIVLPHSSYAFVSAVWNDTLWSGPVTWYQPELVGTGSSWAPLQYPAILTQRFHDDDSFNFKFNSDEQVDLLAKVRIAREGRAYNLEPHTVRIPDRVCLYSRVGAL